MGLDRMHLHRFDCKSEAPAEPECEIEESVAYEGIILEYYAN